MRTKFIEVSQGDESLGGGNWGKFCIAQWTEEEWQRTSKLPAADRQPLIRGRGWGRDHIWVFDLQTGEGACFRPGGLAVADLNKHAIWVCPLFEPFLRWLYAQDMSDPDALPGYVELPDAEFRMSGYRRSGPTSVAQATYATVEVIALVLEAAGLLSADAERADVQRVVLDVLAPESE